MRAFRATDYAVRVSAIALATSMSLSAASAHTVSIGYEFAGPGAVNFWYGSYHNTANFNEADLQLVGPNINSIVAYTLLAAVKPGGLVDGVNNFYSNNAGTLLVAIPEQVAGNGGSFDPATQSVVRWQGVGFTGLAPGTYTFTYNPLGAPTVEWNPINDLIRTGTFTLTAADVLGIDGFGPAATDQNQQAVGQAIDAWINNGGFNQSFYDLALLNGADLPAALSQLSGEALTQVAAAGFQDMGAFLAAMLDPWGGSGAMRGGDFGAGGASFPGGFGGLSAPNDNLFGGSPYGGYGGSLYGGSPYGSAPYGTSPYGSSPYGTSPYGTSPYGNAPYGNSPYSNSPYGNSPYGNSPYGNSQYGQRNADGRNAQGAPAPSRYRANEADRRCGTPLERRHPMSDPCWGAWMTSYGSYTHMNGDPIVGSHDTTLRSAGMIAGLDYRYAPGGIVGAAFSAGSTHWGLSQGLGGGSAEIFQGGAYASQRFGASYLSAAFAYARQTVESDRTVTLAGSDRLVAEFAATGIGGRIEAGHRFGDRRAGITPYVAGQLQRWNLPAYAESAATGANVFGLSVGARSAEDLRTEAGIWIDRLVDVRNGSLLLRARAAWKHDWRDAAVVDAAFQALPGSSFTVTGAAQAADAALVSLASEWRIAGGWSLGAKFDGEFSTGSQTYAGSATLRYQW